MVQVKWQGFLRGFLPVTAVMCGVASTQLFSASMVSTVTKALPAEAAAQSSGMQVPAVVPSRPAHVGIHVRNGRVVEENGRDLILRGVNHGFIWAQNKPQAFTQIKATGANAIRIPISSGNFWPATPKTVVSKAITLCKVNRLICVLDVHDTNGYGDHPGAASLDQAADYWVSLKPVLTGTESFVVLNLGDEPYGGTIHSTWLGATVSVIKKLRLNGLKHALMVDSADWGQDDSRLMRNDATKVEASDPQHNIIFDIHMYDGFKSWKTVKAYMAFFHNRKMPLVVGEFAAWFMYGTPNSEAIFRYAKQYGFGYLAWAWSGQGPGLPKLDVVTNYDPHRLTPWGRRLIYGVYGLKQLSKEASTFSTD